METCFDLHANLNLDQSERKSTQVHQRPGQTESQVDQSYQLASPFGQGLKKNLILQIKSLGVSDIHVLLLQNHKIKLKAEGKFVFKNVQNCFKAVLIPQYLYHPLLFSKFI